MRPERLILFLILLTIFSCVSKQENESIVLYSINELHQRKVYTNIDSLPQELDSVFRLDLSEQQLTKVPEIVYKLTNLQELNLSQNQISNLNGIENLKSIQVLNIGMNDFKIFPIEITKLNSLKVLDIWHNDIKTLPEEFFTNNDKIEELDLTSMFEFDFKANLNKIHSFRNLRRLNLGNNQIPLLTIKFDKLDNLEEFGYIKQDTIDIKELCLQLTSCRKLRTVHLSVNNIRELPNEITHLENLEELNLFQNKLKALPSNITKMKKLKEINLIDNPVDEFKINNIEQKMPQTKIIY